MKLLKMFPVAIALFVMGSSAFAQKKKDSEEPATEYGVVYSLPQTGVRLTIEAEEVRFFHGPYHEYASSLLGLEDAASSDYVDWSIQSVAFEAYSEADPNATFTALGEDAYAISLTDEGVLIGINKAVATPQSTARFTTFIGNIQAPDEIWPDRSMHSFINDDDTVSSKGWSTISVEEKAMEAAHDITKLRKRRFNTLAANYDQLPPDGKSYEVLVKELTALENEYVGLFIGKTVKRKHHYTFEVVPDEKGVVAFRFAADRGILPANDVSGRPVMLTLSRTSTVNSNQNTAKQKVSGNTDFYYRVPARATVRLQNGSTTIAQSVMSFSQLGTVIPFNDKLIEERFQIELHPLTGAIKSITPPVIKVVEED